MNTTEYFPVAIKNLYMWLIGNIKAINFNITSNMHDLSYLKTYLRG
jgi:hypothetical protein